MSSAKAFLFGKGAPAAGAATASAPRPPVTADEQERLYEELLAALGRRGLTALAHPCQHCGELATTHLTKYPEVKMACRDAAAAWLAAVGAHAPEAKR